MLLILLLVTSLRISIIGCLEQSFEVERYDTGDAFYWPGNKNCADFNGYFRAGINTTDCITTLRCCCLYGYTFDTLTGNCTQPDNKYQFDRQGFFSTSVSAMQAYCPQSEQLKDCLLVSTTVGVQLPVVFKGDDGEVYSLGSCDVNDVRIIHDCKSRRLSEVTAKLRQHNINGKYYLHLEPLSYEIITKLEGELLEVAINCSECGIDKLLFKFVGKVDLSQDKRLPKEFIPHYDPSHYPNSSSCPNQTVIPPSRSTLNTKPSKDAMILIITGPLSVCIVLVLILAGYYYRQKRKARRINVGPRQRLIPEGAEGEQLQPPFQPLSPVQATVSTDESVDSNATRSTRSTRSTSSNMTSSLSTVVDLETSQAPHHV